jgi:hypothetical protein
MSLEDLLKLNTEALDRNTAAHDNLAKVAVAASGSKAAAPKDETPAEPTAAEKKKAAAAKGAATKKAAAEKKAKEAPDLVATATVDEARTAAKAYLGSGDEEFRETAKANAGAAFKHIGVKNLGEMEDGEDAGKFLNYVNNWAAGHEVNFEEIDEAMSELEGDDGDDGLG